MKKRIGAFLCALLLAFNLVATAPRARAVSAALAAAGVGVVLGAALAAAGIYPYKAAESFGEWTSDKLSTLWEQFCESTEGIAAGATVAMYTSGGLKGYLMNSTIVIPYAVYNVVAAFTSWVASHFALENNQTGVGLGTALKENGVVPVVSVYPDNASDMLAVGMPVRTYTASATGKSFTNYLVTKFQSIYLFRVVDGDTNYSYLYFVGSADIVGAQEKYALSASLKLSGSGYDQTYYNLTEYGPFTTSVTILGQPIRYTRDRNLSGSYSRAIPVFESYGAGMTYYVNHILGGGSSPVMADTGSVNPLAPLAEGTEYGGLAVAGSGVLNTPADVIEQGITDREKPVVRPVEVDLSGVEVDTETGELTENPVIVRPSDIPLSTSDYAIPGLHTVFPFSIPWDIYNVYSALNAAPVRPSFDVSLYVPVLDITVPFKIEIPEDISEDVDNFAALVRSFLLVLMCIGTLLFVRELIR